jgi:diguanylate cyclase (GGDEF)-like protein
MPHGGMVARPGDGLAALIRFARLAAGADFGLAFEAGEVGLAEPLAADPGPMPRPFTLGRTKFAELDWSQGPQDVGALGLPSSVLLAVDRPVQQALFIPTPFPGAGRSGVLLLWAANRPWRCECPFRDDMEGSVLLLQSAFGQMLADRHGSLQRQLAADRFHDLFETVPTGLVVLDGEGASGMANARAAELLGISPGTVAASLLAERMRALRGRCRNREALETLYLRLQADVDYHATAKWILDAAHIEVETHPILGSGRQGRIWMFHDVTVQDRLAEELRLRAQTDSLTGLPNRGHFFDVGTAAVATAAVARALGGADSEAPLSLLLLDIDHFKSINDGFGHPVGDEVLRELASRCRGLLRGRDLMARIGGEEFVVLLPETKAMEAVEIGERLRGAFARAPVKTQGGPVAVTISMGCATLAAGGETLDGLLKRADVALYEAKHGGRNRVVFSEA